MRIVTALVALATIGGVQDACSPAPPPTPAQPPCQGRVILVELDAPLGCDLLPPQMLIELDTPEADCLDKGGRPFAPARGPRLCIALDY